MLKNITLKIDDQILRRVRHLAVDENKSVSAWVSELIARALHEADEYEQVRREAIDSLSMADFISAADHSVGRRSMTAVDIFIDTNILIYAHDLDAGDKHHRASQLNCCVIFGIGVTFPV